MLHCLQRNILTKWLTLVCSHIWNKWHNLKMCINKYEEIRVQNISSESPSTDYSSHQGLHKSGSDNYE